MRGEASTVESAVVKWRISVGGGGGGILMAEADMRMMRLLKVASQRKRQ